MGKKKKRQQPSPKHKKQKTNAKSTLGVDYVAKMREYGKRMLKILADKDTIHATIQAHIAKIEGYFRRYDNVQLLGGIGLYLIDNLNNLEKIFMSQMSGAQVQLDEDAEVIAEYAFNFGLAVPNDNREEPTDEVLFDLRETLRALIKIYGLLEMPQVDDANQWISWVIHSEFISIRGDGYQEHTEQVFKEMFYPHSKYFEQTYGYSVEQLFDFLTKVEDRIICKIGSQDMIYGAQKMHQRWVEWDERTNGKVDDIESLKKRDFSKGLFGDFFEANPDVPTTEDKSRFLMYQPDDFTGSEKIFWVYPQSEIESKIMDSLSIAYGDNASFLAEGDYKGNIMNGHSIFEKPFVKDGDRYYCFTPMIPHRNMFLIVEKLMMRNDASDHYYTQNFKQQSSPIGRDNYVEGKVRSVLESFLPNVQFRSSVHYKVVEDGVEKKPELDIIGVSGKAAYIIEVKGHELTRNDRVKIKGTIDKFKGSAVEACYQCQRAKNSVAQQDTPQFTNKEGVLTIDKGKPIYKIAVTFQHYSTLLGNFSKLVEAGLMKEEYRDTLVVSLFDLMIMSEFIQSEDEWINYLEIHNEIYEKNFTFMDEIDILNGFVNFDLVEQIHRGKTGIIRFGSKEIDDEYNTYLKLPFFSDQKGNN